MQHTTSSQIIDESLRPFRLGPVLIHPAKNQIEINHTTKKLQPKAMAVLAYLANHNDRVISSDELIEVLWVGRIVTQSSVQKSINTIRKMLAEHIPDKTIIENYSKKGYQLCLKPEFVESNEHEHTSTLPISKLTRYKALTFPVIALLVLAYFINDDASSGKMLTPNSNHKVNFSKSGGFSERPLQANLILPHPNNADLLIARTEILNVPESLDTLLIKNTQTQEDWRIASTTGKWKQTAWSPNGKHLVAIEQQEDALQPKPFSFYGNVPLLYTFHIFTFDLSSKKIEEKQLLSQWHGNINSVTWLNNEEFEFIATQGESTTFQRYKYFPNGQALDLIEPNPAILLPTYSAASDKFVALVTEHKSASQIHFTDHQRQLISSWPIDFKVMELSWIPDGSGVLISNQHRSELILLYVNGEQTSISLNTIHAPPKTSVRFSADGQKIYYATSEQNQELTYHSFTHPNKQDEPIEIAGSQATLASENNELIYAYIAPSGAQIWQVSQDNRNKMLTELTGRSFSDLIWLSNQGFVYKADSVVYYYDLATNTIQRVLSEAYNIEPIYFDMVSNKLIALVKEAQTKNLWVIDLNKNSRKQLTFGTIGSIKFVEQNIYYQYIGQKGLWELNLSSLNTTQISKHVPANSKVVFVNETTSYFITGSQCAESDIFIQYHADEYPSIFMHKEFSNLTTVDFHPYKGLITKQCKPYPTTINVLE